jgi:hypothetical protein
VKAGLTGASGASTAFKVASIVNGAALWTNCLNRRSWAVFLVADEGTVITQQIVCPYAGVHVTNRGVMHKVLTDRCFNGENCKCRPKEKAE